MGTTEKPDLERAWKIILPALWGVHRFVSFNDGLGVLSIEAIRSSKPSMLKLSPDGTRQVKAVAFSLEDEAEWWRSLDAEVEEIDADTAHALRYEHTVSQEYQLRCSDHHDKADRLFEPRLVLDPYGRVEHEPLEQQRTTGHWEKAETRKQHELNYEGRPRVENFARGGDPFAGEVKSLPPDPPKEAPAAGTPPHELLREGALTSDQAREMEADLTRASQAKQAVAEKAVDPEKKPKGKFWHLPGPETD